jgi:predicted transcriptional regulator of viral defense system
MRTITMAIATTYRQQLHERALEQYGFVTTRDAEAIGVPDWAVRQIAARGGLTRYGHGLYRFDDVPATDRDQFMEAVLEVGEGAHLVGDAVLALHRLADVNPRRIRVGTPRRTRTAVPQTVEIVPRQDMQEDLTIYEGIPTTTVARALIDAQGTVMTERLVDAATEARERGLLLSHEADQVFARLGVAK